MAGMSHDVKDWERWRTCVEALDEMDPALAAEILAGLERLVSLGGELAARAREVLDEPAPRTPSLMPANGISRPTSPPRPARPVSRSTPL
jgi:hypothetical protein